MKARLLKKLRKESKKLKLIRGEDYQCRRNWILSEVKRMRVHLRKSRIRIYKE